MTDFDNLLRFAGKAFAAVRHRIGVDWDGGDIQDAMVECGLLQAVRMTEPCSEACECAAVDDFPLTCYGPTALGDRASAIESNGPGGT